MNTVNPAFGTTVLKGFLRIAILNNYIKKHTQTEKIVCIHNTNYNCAHTHPSDM